jgi:hypothetical protein
MKSTTQQLEKLDVMYYEPSDSYEYYDPKSNTFYNVFGQQLRHPESYRATTEAYTPFGDE